MLLFFNTATLLPLLSLPLLLERSSRQVLTALFFEKEEEEEKISFSRSRMTLHLHREEFRTGHTIGPDWEVDEEKEEDADVCMFLFRPRPPRPLNV